MEKKDDKKGAKKKRPRMPLGEVIRHQMLHENRTAKNVTIKPERVIATDVKATDFSIEKGRLLYNEYTLNSGPIPGVNIAFFSKVDLTFTIKEDVSCNSKVPLFKFADKGDLNRLVQAAKEAERKHKKVAFPIEVKGSDFTLSGNKLFYKDYFLKSERLLDLNPAFFETVQDTFTIVEDLAKKPIGLKFQFSPNDDLSKFINAVKQLEEREAKEIKELQKRDADTWKPTWIPLDRPVDGVYPATGIIRLPWGCVTFFEGRMLLKHPNPSVVSTIHPFLFSHQLIHKSFNDMKGRFRKRCVRLVVRAINGEIKELLNFSDFIKIIREINTYSGKTEADYEITDGKPLKPGSALTLNEFKSRRVIKKSPYISMLSNIHVASLPIYYLLENVVHRSSEFSSEEHGYLFAIRQSMGEVIAVYENISDDSRASMVFRCSSHRYDEAVKWISTFLSSEVENKRELIARGQIKVSNSMVRDLMRVLHTDQDRWRTQILNLRLYGF